MWHRICGIVFITACLVAKNSHPAKAFEAESAGSSNFSIHDRSDERIKKNYEFWIQVNSKYSTGQGLVHDAQYVDHIYEVLDLKKGRRNSSRLIGQSKLKWKKVLFSVHQKQDHPEKMTADEKKVFEMFRDINEPNKFLNAAHRKRMRFQLGQKDRFLDGLYQSGKYIKGMEDVFRRAGLPVELTRLPFVESSFNLRARSKVGASGIWQFMKSTAQIFIQVNDAVDERNDPIRATEAAAKLLRLNYLSLRNWPLAVTAYNHGRKNLMRAVRRVGTDRLEDLISEYNGRSFGFASGNFFAELLAMVELERNAGRYFENFTRANEIAYYEVQVTDFIRLSSLVKFLSLDLDEVQDLNPGLTEAVYSDRLWVPKGYYLRLAAPKSGTYEQAIEKFRQIYQQIPQNLKESTQPVRKYGKGGGLFKFHSRKRKSSSF